MLLPKMVVKRVVIKKDFNCVEFLLVKFKNG